MANHGLTNEQARQIGAKTLWIGDIEPWMDEQYISNLFNKVREKPECLTMPNNVFHFLQYAVIQNVKLIRDKLKGAPVGK